MNAQLDMESAIRARDEAITRVTASAGEAWLEQAYQWLVVFLRYHPHLRPDDAKSCGCPPPPSGEWRAFGPVVARARREGLIERAGTAPRASGHGAEAPRWQSLIFEEDAA